MGGKGWIGSQIFRMKAKIDSRWGLTELPAGQKIHAKIESPRQDR